MYRSPTRRERKKIPFKELNFIESIKLVTFYLIEDMKRGPIQYKIAVFTIFIIVAFMAVLLNSKSITTTAFLSLAESQTGDTDFIITPQFSHTGKKFNETSELSIFNEIKLLNISEIIEKVKRVNSISGASERWIFPGRLYNAANDSLSTSTYAILGDSLRERSLGLGRALTEVDPLHKNECYMLKRTAEILKIDQGSENITLNFKIEILKFLSQNKLETNSSENIAKMYVNQIPDQYILKADEVIDALKAIPNRSLKFESEIPEGVTPTDLNDYIKGVLDGSIDPGQSGITHLSYDNAGTKKIIEDTINDIMDLRVELTPKYFLDSPKGKWAGSLGNVVMFEREFFFNFLREEIIRNLDKAATKIQQDITDTVSGGDLFAYNLGLALEKQILVGIIEDYDKMDLISKASSMTLVVKDKAGVYGSFSKYDDRLVKISNDIMGALGDSSRFTITSPLLTGFEFLGYLSMFIEGLIYAILILFAILSYILINSLMAFSIDEKTYEFGMLRALGLKKQNLVYMLFIQGIFYSVSGWSVGVLSSFIMTSLIKYMFYVNVRVKIGITMEVLAWIMTVFFGFATPIFTNFTSIRRSLSSNLKDSLDLYRRSANKITVIFVKLARLGISKTSFVLAIQFTVYGILFYYVAPMFFFFGQIGYFLLLLNFVFLGMILGLTVIANLLQPFLERVILKICQLFMFKNRSLVVVIDKNLNSHDKRNVKTALMMTMSVCFIIFSGSGIRMNAIGLVNQVLATQGGDLVLERSLERTDLYGFDQEQITQFLEEYKKENPGKIKSYCWSTKSLTGFKYIERSLLTPLSLFPKIDALITGVNSTLMDSIVQDLYVPNSYQDGVEYKTLSNKEIDGVSSIFDGEVPVVEEKYDKNNIISLNAHKEQKLVKVRNIKAVLPSGFTPETGISVDTPSILTIYGIDFTYAKINITHTANKVPGFGFSKYGNQIKNSHDILVSLEAYKNLVEDIKEVVDSLDSATISENFYGYETNEVQNSKYKLPYNKLQIKLEDGSTVLERDEIINGIKTFMSDIDSIIDTITIKEQTESSLKYLSILNGIISFLTTVIAFFMLLISLIKNIKDNVWELGILRSIGLNYKQIYLIYFIETFSVVFSSLVLGTIVGLLVALSGTLYYVIFFELPFYIYFPYFEFFLLFGFLTATSFLTTYFGLKGIVYQSIAKILKGLI